MAVPQRWLDTTTTKPECFRFKARITVRTPVNGNINNVEITVPLKYLSHFWRTLKISLLTENNTKLLQQWYSGFKRTVNHSKYLAKDTTADPEHNLHYLVSPSFQRFNRLFVLSFEHETGKKRACDILPFKSRNKRLQR